MGRVDCKVGKKECRTTDWDASAVMQGTDDNHLPKKGFGTGDGRSGKIGSISEVKIAHHISYCSYVNFAGLSVCQLCLTLFLFPPWTIFSLMFYLATSHSSFKALLFHAFPQHPVFATVVTLSFSHLLTC